MQHERGTLIAAAVGAPGRQQARSAPARTKFAQRIDEVDPRSAPARTKFAQRIDEVDPRSAAASFKTPGARVRQIARMRQRVSLITLGVRDLARARRFYEALGSETGAKPEA